MRIAVALAVCTGCAMSADSGPDAPPGDGATSCDTFLEFDPPMPIAGPATVVRAEARVVNAPGVLGYTWTVTFQGVPIGTSFAQADHSAITFPAVAPGIYRVRMSVSSPAQPPCPDEVVDFNVYAEGGNMSQVRLHVTPAASASTPPVDMLQLIHGGAPSSLGNVVLQQGIEVTSQVRLAGNGVGAYVKFMPVVGREAIVETYSNMISGGFTARLRNEPHDVLVVPTGNTAPQLIKDWTPGSALDLDAGTSISGTVRGAAGELLADAKVQLTIDGVPSTLATTAANGGFMVLAVPRPGAMITVDVTPKAGSGLPRLAASSVFDPAQTFQIAYAPVVLRDLGGSTIRRGGPVANAKLTLVGSVAGAGTVTAGGAPVTANGSVRIFATANGAGVLPATLAPAKPLAAVVETSLNSFAVTSIDLTGGAPGTIDAPATQPIATQIRKPDLAGISGVYVEIVPVGALAMAGVTSVRASSGVNGSIAATLAGGGHYDLRFNDPASRGAPLVVSDVTSSMIQAAYSLRAGLLVTGKLLQPNGLPIGNASVQILCAQCTGLDRDRPLAESASEPGGTFTLVVPDPGVM